tara:strand:+ start:47010 stop:47966 length:957 start_codon:yes stop_codon:yes gene_type:complete
LNSLINYLDKYHAQLTVLLLGLSLIIFAVFVWVWFYNRKKYHHLKHQIPASVVKNYLDSIIQNSTALKSSLFRGGGLEVDAQGVPSVMPLSDLPSSTEINVGSGSDDSALRAEVSKLQAQLAEKDNVIKDLENKNTELGGEVKAKQERIEELEALLAKAESEAGSSDGDPEAAQKMEALQKERDQLEEELKQFEIISDDLADLKRLKQENAQLKKSLGEGDGAASEPAEQPEDKVEVAPPVEQESEPQEEPLEAAPAVSEEPAQAEEAPEAEAAPSEESEEPAAQAAAAGESSGEESEEEGETKTPEDLLSEFEKMLG